MDHEKMKEQILALYDRELEGAVRKETEQHLASCLECKELYESWSKTAQALFQAPKVEASDFFVHQVMQRIQELESPKQRSKWGFSLGWLVPAAGVVALFFVVLSTPDPNLSMDNLLFGPQENTLTADQTLEFVMGGQG